MNVKLPLIAVFAASLALTACGGGGSGGGSTPAVSSPAALTKTDSVVGTGMGTVAGGTVKVHYTGYLYDASLANFKGRQFDSSVGGNPYQFVLGSGTVIAGFDQGVMGMKVGGKRTVLIPSNLGYGASGSQGIPGGSGLVFDLELVSSISNPTALSSTDTLVGTGTVVAAGKTLTVHYTGFLYDGSAANLKGTQFDTSVGKTPFSFKVGAAQVIPGFDQGVLGMKVGGKRTIVIPSALGYGANGTTNIPGNSGIVFDVEVLTAQ